jgi:uncharacterized phage protein (TIGR02220 family)
MAGYILLSKGLIESEIFRKPPLYLKVWIYLLTRAQYGDYRGLKRGQLWVTYQEIIEACSWRVGFRWERPTKSQIHTIIEWLRNPNEGDMNDTMITTMKATRGILVTIDNYDHYQDSKNYESNNEAAMNDTRKQRQPNTINKEIKNNKNKDICCVVIDYLNKKCDKKFKPTTKQTVEFINGRISDGYSLDDFKKVIDVKSSQWQGTKQESYLRPQTLFRPGNFESYLNECVDKIYAEDSDEYKIAKFFEEKLQKIDSKFFFKDINIICMDFERLIKSGREPKEVCLVIQALFRGNDTFLKKKYSDVRLFCKDFADVGRKIMMNEGKADG